MQRKIRPSQWLCFLLASRRGRGSAGLSPSRTHHAISPRGHPEAEKGGREGLALQAAVRCSRGHKAAARKSRSKDKSPFPALPGLVHPLVLQLRPHTREGSLPCEQRHLTPGTSPHSTGSCRQEGPSTAVQEPVVTMHTRAHDTHTTPRYTHMNTDNTHAHVHTTHMQHTDIHR